jgi:acyl dehydratase
MPAELRVGERIPDLRLTMELWPMKVFSMVMADPNPIHFDPEATERLGMGRHPVNQGTLNLGYVIDAVLAVVEDPARIRSTRCRFLGNVLEGDVVKAGGEVTAVEDGIAELEVWLDVEGRGRAISGTMRVAAD